MFCKQTSFNCSQYSGNYMYHLFLTLKLNIFATEPVRPVGLSH